MANDRLLLVVVLGVMVWAMFIQWRMDAHHRSVILVQLAHESVRRAATVNHAGEPGRLEALAVAELGQHPGGLLYSHRARRRMVRRVLKSQGRLTATPKG